MCVILVFASRKCLEYCEGTRGSAVTVTKIVLVWLIQHHVLNAPAFPYYCHTYMAYMRAKVLIYEYPGLNCVSVWDSSWLCSLWT